jgi:hypothetical protein
MHPASGSDIINHVNTGAVELTFITGEKHANKQNKITP